MIFVREMIDTNSNMQSKLMINPGTLLSGAMFRRAERTIAEASPRLSPNGHAAINDPVRSGTTLIG